MNKKLNIEKKAYILFALNIIALIATILFKTIYTKLNYSIVLVNIMLVINIIILICGILYNVLLVKDAKKYNKNITLKIIIGVFIIYFILNTVVMIVFNKTANKGFDKINKKVAGYCEIYGCDKFTTEQDGINEKFIIDKTYYDYNNVENNIRIEVKYSTSQIISVTANVYCQNELFSEAMINDEIKNYFINYGYETKEELIREAFDNRFEKSISDGSARYKVTEEYNKDGELDKLKTTITLTLKQE